jgi:hypothetical protein
MESAQSLGRFNLAAGSLNDRRELAEVREHNIVGRLGKIARFDW